MHNIQALIAQNRLTEAGDALAQRVAAREAETGGHAEEAELAEELGLASVALRAWQLAARDAPQDLVPWTALARLHEERGEPERAQAARDRMRSLGASPATSRPSEEPPLPGPSDADLVRFVARFVGREGVHARMWHDPGRGIGYSPLRQPFTVDLARAHLSGAITVGIYLVRVDDSAGQIVLDLDATAEALSRAEGDAARTRALRAELASEGLRLRQELLALGLDALLVDSGYKGRHLWLSLAEPLPAAQARRFGQLLSARLRPASPNLRVEVFPKQGEVAPGGLGSLVKLPLGVHLRTGRRAELLDEQGAPLPDPFARLRSWTPSSVQSLERATQGVNTAAEAASASQAAPSAPPVVPAPSRAWSEADFETSPEVATVLRGCAPLRTLIEDALSTRTVSHDASVALNHTLGHLAEGVRACNYVYDRVPQFPAESRLGAPHRGSPMGCSRLRSRVPDVVSRVPCECSFAEAPGRYPHPLRHLERAAPAPAAIAPSLDELVGAYSRQQDRLRQVQAELDEQRRALVAALSRVPGGVWPAPGGLWRLRQDEGLPVLEWQPAESG